MAQRDVHHDHDHDHHGTHHDAGHGAHALPYDMEEVDREITADRHWMFTKFLQFTFWNIVGIFVILALLALTQT